MINQMIDLVQTLPQAMSNLRSFAQEHFPSLFEDNSQVREALAGLWKIVQDNSVTLLQTFAFGDRAGGGCLSLGGLGPDGGAH